MWEGMLLVTFPIDEMNPQVDLLLHLFFLNHDFGEKYCSNLLHRRFFILYHLVRQAHFAESLNKNYPVH